MGDVQVANRGQVLIFFSIIIIFFFFLIFTLFVFNSESIVSSIPQETTAQ